MIGLGGFAKVFFVTRQALLQVFGEGIGADLTEYINVAVVAILQAL